eukprot:2851128-Alexandrium_andersonii.AAC.1
MRPRPLCTQLPGRRSFLDKWLLGPARAPWSHSRLKWKPWRRPAKAPRDTSWWTRLNLGQAV